MRDNKQPTLVAPKTAAEGAAALADGAVLVSGRLAVMVTVDWRWLSFVRELHGGTFAEDAEEVGATRRDRWEPGPDEQRRLYQVRAERFLQWVKDESLAPPKRVPSRDAPPRASLLKRWRQDQAARARVAKGNGRSEAAAELAREAMPMTSTGDGWVLSPPLLLGPVLGPITRDGPEQIAFVKGATDFGAYSMALLRRCKVLLTYRGLACYLDGDGLHFRWRDGRGGLDFRAHERERGTPPLEVALPDANLYVIPRRRPRTKAA